MEEPNPYQSPKDAGEGVVVARHAVQLGGVFGQAWGLYTRNFTLIAAAIIVIWLPLNLLSSYLSYVVLGPDDIFGVLLLIAVLDAFFGIIAEAWILAIGLAAMTGGTATLSGTLIRSLRAYFRMFLTRLLCELFTLVCLLFCVVPGIYVGIRMVLAESVVMAEGVSGVAAIRRSFELTRGYFWFVFLIGLVFIGFGVVVSFLTTVPVLLAPAWDTWIFDAVTSSVLDLMIAYFSLCFLCVYVRLRGPQPVAAAKDAGGKPRGKPWSGGRDDDGLR